MAEKLLEETALMQYKYTASPKINGDTALHSRTPLLMQLVLNSMVHFWLLGGFIEEHGGPTDKIYEYVLATESWRLLPVTLSLER